MKEEPELALRPKVKVKNEPKQDEEVKVEVKLESEAWLGTERRYCKAFEPSPIRLEKGHSRPGDWSSVPSRCQDVACMLESIVVMYSDALATFEGCG